MEMETNLERDPALAPEPVVEVPASGAVESIRRDSGGASPWWKKAAFLLGAAALIFALAGYSYRTFEAWADSLRFPQEGRSVDVGGYALNLNCTGQGSPTVILEAGLGVPAISWRPIQSEVAKFTRVCSYDRAGYDWSDPGPLPRTAAQNVKELHALLQSAAEKPPYLLVGHSYGGAYVRVYAAQYPADVTGLVLADTGNEDLKAPAFFQKLLDGERSRHQRDRRWGGVLYSLGINRFLSAGDIENPATSLTAREYSYFVIQPKFINAAANEFDALELDKRELLAARDFGDKPLLVLIAQDCFAYLPLSPEEREGLNKQWTDLEMGLANYSRRGKWVLVPGASHMIVWDRPDAIVSAIREVFDASSLNNRTGM